MYLFYFFISSIRNVFILPAILSFLFSGQPAMSAHSTQRTVVQGGQMTQTFLHQAPLRDMTCSIFPFSSEKTKAHGNDVIPSTLQPELQSRAVSGSSITRLCGFDKKRSREPHYLHSLFIGKNQARIYTPYISVVKKIPTRKLLISPSQSDLFLQNRGPLILL